MIDRALRVGLVAILVGASGLLAYGAAAVQQAAPPIPDRVVVAAGPVLYTRDDVLAGKDIFQRTDLMDLGSLYGNGSYFGPDWGTEHLDRLASGMRDGYARLVHQLPYASLSASDRGVIDLRVKQELRGSQLREGVLTVSDAYGAAYRAIAASDAARFVDGDDTVGIRANTVATTGEAGSLTAFISSVAWTYVSQRPGETFTYTNNWPYMPEVGNVPTPTTYWWSWVSIVGLLLLAPILFVAYRRWIVPAGDAPAAPALVVGAPTGSQRAVRFWSLLVPVLLIAQGLIGALIAHAYADRSGFFGLDPFSVLPFQVLKAWHLQIAIAWIAAAWMGAGLFLAPLVARREPRGQGFLAYALLAVVAFVVVGSAIGLWAGVTGRTGDLWYWIGSQGLEYVQLGRAWQIGLFVGLIVWALIVARGFWPAIRQGRAWGGLEGLLLYSGLAIGFVYAFGLIPMRQVLDSVTLTDFYRWFVVHLWVENVFESFTVIVTGFALMSMGLLSRRFVERAAYFELILVFGSGIVGIGHHYYWIGDPAVWLGLGGVFSALELIPLVVMMAAAWAHYRVARPDFPQRVAFSAFMSAALWNVVGAGALGFIINPPLLNYFAHGGFLTLAHAHASMFGVFGMLAIGLVYFGARYLAVRPWSDRLGLLAVRLFNVSIVLWLVLNLIPIGAAQLLATLEHGYAYARSVAFYDQWTVLQWARLPGDVVFLVAGAVFLVDLVRMFALPQRTPRPAMAPRPGTVGV